MDRESFLDTVKNHYVDEINEAYHECRHHHGEQVNFAKLTAKINRLKKQAITEGVLPHEFDELVRATVPMLWKDAGKTAHEHHRHPKKKSA